MRIAAVSLGCDKNRIDTENMLFLLRQAGYEFVSDVKIADIIVINTCGFIESAKKEAIDTILDMLASKKEEAKLIVTGCMVERYSQELKQLIPEISALVGVQSENDIVQIVESIADCRETVVKIAKKFKPYVCGRLLTTPPHYAYLRIADGCDNKCTYCAIPAIRGKYHSVPMDALIEEAKWLVSIGVTELNIVAQDITCYGTDIYGKPMLCALLRELIKLSFWKIRLLYTYPEEIDDELIEMVSKEKKIAKYLDIPLQHINSSVLKRMNRRSSGEEIRALLKKIKNANPNIAVRSTFIVGFNGETEEAYAELKDFISTTDDLDYVGFFGYSVEEGTPASRFKEKNLPKSVINKRRKELEKIWSSRIVEKHKKYVGKTLEVLYEDIDYDKNLFVGRTENNAPDVDTVVYFSSEALPEVGNVYKVRIEKADFNLYGRTVND